MLYGTKLKSVNEARYTIFEKKRQKEDRMIDMAALPPCEVFFTFILKQQMQ